MILYHNVNGIIIFTATKNYMNQLYLLIIGFKISFLLFSSIIIKIHCVGGVLSDKRLSVSVEKNITRTEAIPQLVVCSLQTSALTDDLPGWLTSLQHNDS